MLLLLFWIPAAAEELRSAELPSWSRDLSWHEPTDTFIASHTLKGASFVRFGEGTPENYHREDWPTICATTIDDETVLLGDRFKYLRLVSLTDGEPQSIALWPVEDVVNDLLLDGDRLIAAGGGIGIQVYQWKGPDEAPHLRSRYPFVDFSRQIVLDANKDLYIADNVDTGLQVINVEDMLRPRFLSKTPSGYVVSVAKWKDQVFIAVRRDGTMVYDVSNPAKPEELAFLLRQNFTGEKENIVEEVTINDDGHLIIIESEKPARFYQVNESGEEPLLAPLSAPPFSGTVLQQALFLPDGRLAVISEQNRLIAGPYEARLTASPTDARDD